MNRTLGLYRTDSKVSIHSLRSLAGSSQTRSALQEFFRDLGQMGIGADLIKKKRSEIIIILKTHNIATSLSGQVDGSNIVGQSKPHDAAMRGQLDGNTIADHQLQEVCGFSRYRNFIY